MRCFAVSEALYPNGNHCEATSLVAMVVVFGWRRIASKARHPWLAKGTGLSPCIALIVSQDGPLVHLLCMRLLLPSMGHPYLSNGAVFAVVLLLHSHVDLSPSSPPTRLDPRIDVFSFFHRHLLPEVSMGLSSDRLPFPTRIDFLFEPGSTWTEREGWVSSLRSS